MSRRLSRNRTNPLLVTGLLAIGLLAAACGGGDGTPAPDPTTPAPAATTAASTSTPPQAGATGTATVSPTATVAAGETAVVAGKPIVYWVHTEW